MTIEKLNKKVGYERGTTLVEAIVVVFILSFGLIPSFFTVISANNLATAIKNNLIADNLAQEGLEVVRAIRDSNWFTGNSFDLGLGDGNYRVVWNSTGLLPESSNPLLKLDSQGLYNYSTGTDTIFHRRLVIAKIDPAGCNCELRIISEVSWQEKSRTKTIRAESHLFNWK